MAGSIVVTTQDLGSKITKYRVVWTSDSSGVVSGNTFELRMGTLIGVEFTPGSGGSQPDLLYDVDLLDTESATLFDDGSGNSIGNNLSNAVSTNHVPLVGLTGVTLYRRWHHGGLVQLTIAAAGSTKSGTVDIYLMEGVL